MNAARRLGGLLAGVLSLAGVMLLAPAASAQAATYASPRWHAYEWALSQKGCWYNYGAQGPCSQGYDCSGLVRTAYAHAGIWLPRTTYEMLSFWRLRRIPYSQARPGDLVFMYGGGHVEFVTRWRLPAFGAHHTGTRVSFDWWSNVYGFYHVIGAR